jgi:hypothetical protein
MPMGEKPATLPEKRGRPCALLVRGPVGPTVLQAFPTLTGHRRGPDTLLSGSFRDQSELYGVIHQLEVLGLELLELRGLQSEPSESDPGSYARSHDD